MGGSAHPSSRSILGRRWITGSSPVMTTAECEAAIFLTRPWRGRVGSHEAERNAKRGGVTGSPHAQCPWRDHPTSTSILLRAMLVDPPPPGEDKCTCCDDLRPDGLLAVRQMHGAIAAGRMR